MNAAANPRRSGSRLGRFQLLDELGRGAQATVWRAHDGRLDREVALKLPNGGLDGPALDHWLHEARAAGRLAHPHVVAVYDAEVLDGQPCLVFELVEGRTLAQRLRAQGAMPAREAVALMLGVVDALRAAHAQGIVHRDLKPSNILVDGAGRARVMDFGIAAVLAGTAARPAGVDALAGCVVGSPGYLSPEAAAGAPADPRMDVFAAGLVLGELLCGRRLLAETDPWRALQRVQHEDLRLPDDADGDDQLRAVVQRAIARDPQQRYDSAASLRDALAQWLTPADSALPATTGHGTLDFLLRRMRHKSDFPALTEHVLRIQRMAASETDRLNELADEILKDVALTQKLLRLVNTAHFRRDRHGVGTVSRAVALVGQAGIRNLALSLVLVEHMKDKAHAQRIKEEFLRALLAAQLAHELSSTPRDAEEAFLGALFYNLGRLLTEYYFPDEADAVREQLRRAAPDAGLHPDQAADHAAALVLGLGFEALGVGVARHWGLPELLQRCMRRPEAASPPQPLAPGPEQLRWLAVAANELADALWRADAAGLPGELEALAQRHGRALGLGQDELRRAAASARSALAEMARAMGLVPPQGTRGAQILAGLPAPQAAAGNADVAGQLAAGIQDITDALAADSVRLDEVLRRVLETLYHGLGLQRVVFCLRDAASGRLQGRFGLGDRAAALAPQFQIALRWPAGQAPDLFGAVCLKGSDTLIADSREPAIAPSLPAWYRRHVAAPSFLLLPMLMKGAPFALIYGDHARPGGLPLADRELALVRTLRNQAVVAFRQAGTGA